MLLKQDKILEKVEIKFRRTHYYEPVPKLLYTSHKLLNLMLYNFKLENGEILILRCHNRDTKVELTNCLSLEEYVVSNENMCCKIRIEIVSKIMPCEDSKLSHIKFEIIVISQLCETTIFRSNDIKLKSRKKLQPNKEEQKKNRIKKEISKKIEVEKRKIEAEKKEISRKKQATQIKKERINSNNANAKENNHIENNQKIMLKNKFQNTEFLDKNKYDFSTFMSEYDYKENDQEILLENNNKIENNDNNEFIPYCFKNNEQDHFYVETQFDKHDWTPNKYIEFEDLCVNTNNKEIDDFKDFL
jgi:hypothetical protein